MAISVLKQALEIEELVGSRQGQALLRAEAIVPGAGRDAIETLMAEADLVIGQVDVQEGRVVLEGTAHCQAVYRQGDDASLRALTAQAQLNHAFELPGAAGDMPCRVAGEVEHVEARYENGHMVFLVSVGLKLQVWKLTPAEIVTGIEGSPALETETETVRSVRLAAESGVDTLLSETVSLPAALDARAALMGWGTMAVEGVEPDLGGVRVRGKLHVEALVSSGVSGRPVALIKVPLSFERLVEMPDWLVENVYATARLNHLETRVEASEDDDEADVDMRIEAEVHISVKAVTATEAAALTDAYATKGPSLEIETQQLTPAWPSSARRRRRLSAARCFCRRTPPVRARCWPCACGPWSAAGGWTRAARPSTACSKPLCSICPAAPIVFPPRRASCPSLRRCRANWTTAPG